MTKDKDLHGHYDAEDQSTAFEDAELIDTVEEVLVSTSIRLSKVTLDRVRSLAQTAGVPATTLMREWIEARASDEPAGLVVDVTDLQKFISTRAHRAS